MKLLLSSVGLTNASITQALSDLAERPLTELKVVYIPTATFIEPSDKSWFLTHITQFHEIGFKYFVICDFSILPPQVWSSRLENADILVFEGGNTYHLLHCVKKTGLDKKLPQLLSSRVYVGISAGSIVVTQSLLLNEKSSKSLLELMDEPMDEVGLGLVDFLVVPHVNSPKHVDRTFTNLETKIHLVPYDVYGLDDQSAIKVNNNDITVVSEGQWKKYTKSNV